ncbi:MAG: hypothetical protein D6724_05595 [Armatimonadetes bacterium]|nr:MAG: hypothetical protein D6724_05595 [Armatimonadota bacterium]
MARSSIPPLKLVHLLTVLQLLVAAVCAGAQGQSEDDSFRFLYPSENGTVFALPHVILFFEARPRANGALPRSVRLVVDGRPIPERAITHCAICAGPHPAVAVREAPWAAAEGEHLVEVVATFDDDSSYRTGMRYRVDSGWTSLVGLNGVIAYPGAVTPSYNGVQSEVVLGERSGTGGGGLSLSVGCGRMRAQGSFGWTGDPGIGAVLLSYEATRRRAAFGVGSVGRSPFAAVEFRDQPVRATLVVGVGTNDLPRAWLGARFSLSNLTAWLRVPHTSDFWAVVDLTQLHVEVDETGAVNYGASISHPYGWSAGLFHLGTRGSWVFSLTLKGAWGLR